LEGRFGAFGADQLISDKFEEIDLAALLSGGVLSGDDKVDLVLKNFTTAYDGDVARRNAIQERILAASEQRCGSYKQFLKGYESQMGFFLGALTTIFAGAGALVSPVAVARALSGTAGVTSGINAEFQEKFFARLTIQVLTKAMGVRRKNIYEAILDRRLVKDKDGNVTGHADLTAYPVEAAIKDALSYHAACSLIAGLEEAGASIERADNPGIEQLDKLATKYPKFFPKPGPPDSGDAAQGSGVRGPAASPSPVTSAPGAAAPRSPR